MHKAKQSQDRKRRAESNMGSQFAHPSEKRVFFFLIITWFFPYM